MADALPEQERERLADFADQRANDLEHSAQQWIEGGSIRADLLRRAADQRMTASLLRRSGPTPAPDEQYGTSLPSGAMLQGSERACGEAWSLIWAVEPGVEEGCTGQTWKDRCERSEKARNECETERGELRALGREAATALPEDVRARITERLAEIDMHRDGGGTTIREEWYTEDVTALLSGHSSFGGGGIAQQPSPEAIAVSDAMIERADKAWTAAKMAWFTTGDTKGIAVALDAGMAMLNAGDAALHFYRMRVSQGRHANQQGQGDANG